MRQLVLNLSVVDLWIFNGTVSSHYKKSHRKQQSITHSGIWRGFAWGEWLVTKRLNWYFIKALRDAASTVSIVSMHHWWLNYKMFADATAAWSFKKEEFWASPNCEASLPPLYIAFIPSGSGGICKSGTLERLYLEKWYLQQTKLNGPAPTFQSQH